MGNGFVPVTATSAGYVYGGSPVGYTPMSVSRAASASQMTGSSSTRSLLATPGPAISDWSRGLSDWAKLDHRDAGEKVSLEEEREPIRVEDYVQKVEQQTDNELFTEYEDSQIAAVCDSGSIYTIVWAARSHSAVFTVTLILASLIQILVPGTLLYNHMHMYNSLASELPWNATSLNVKNCAWVLFLFLASTFTGCLNRANVMSFMAPLLPEKAWALHLGAIVVTCCIILSTLATLLLFVQSPAVEDILLNCIALNFLPDVDVSLVGLIEILAPELLVDTQKRLEAVKEAWPTSAEREENIQFWSLSRTERIKERPEVVLIFILRGGMTMLFLALAVASFFFVNPTNDGN
eukprot:TRINITY_DN27040_c0_g1_i1.p1 TRINITY_DN27040_c0_g1~~TRINITY_DN27040_c0_g1_i1.p1  ORF type:complete len:396 (-),score=56.66 TRINITY_DN27040_c0_g1_i1:172-1221(-)